VNIWPARCRSARHGETMDSLYRENRPDHSPALNPFAASYRTRAMERSRPEFRPRRETSGGCRQCDGGTITNDRRATSSRRRRVGGWRGRARAAGLSAAGDRGAPRRPPAGAAADAGRLNSAGLCSPFAQTGRPIRSSLRRSPCHWHSLKTPPRFVLAKRHGVVSSSAAARTLALPSGPSLSSSLPLARTTRGRLRPDERPAQARARPRSDDVNV
jgi:hypothetical protein